MGASLKADDFVREHFTADPATWRRPASDHPLAEPPEVLYAQSPGDPRSTRLPPVVYKELVEGVVEHGIFAVGYAGPRGELIRDAKDAAAAWTAEELAGGGAGA